MQEATPILYSVPTLWDLARTTGGTDADTGRTALSSHTVAYIRKSAYFVVLLFSDNYLQHLNVGKVEVRPW